MGRNEEVRERRNKRKGVRRTMTITKLCCITCSWYSMVENCGISSAGWLVSEMAA